MSGASEMEQSAPFDRLIGVVARLRAPDGCPWDREQTHQTLVPYVIEEAHEVADAIARGDAEAIPEELGDVLLQVMLHARIAEEEGRFTVNDVVTGLTDKLIRRHPHVFADEHASTAEEVTQRWERIKQEEKKRKGDVSGMLQGVPKALPALQKAQRLTEKAGRTGFDWPDAEAVLAKLHEEVAEFDVEVRAGRIDDARAELGDLLFVLANMARHLKIDAEAALQQANAKFTRRFEHVEGRLREQGRSPSEASLAEMDSLWDEAKQLE